MTLLRSLKRGWLRLRAAARREFLRDPNLVLLERAAEPAPNGTGVR